MKKENKTEIDSGVNNELQFNIDKQLLDNPVYRETDLRDRKRTIYKLIYFFFFAVFSEFFCIISATLLYQDAFIKKSILHIYTFILDIFLLGGVGIYYFFLFCKSYNSLKS